MHHGSRHCTARARSVTRRKQAVSGVLRRGTLPTARSRRLGQSMVDPNEHAVLPGQPPLRTPRSETLLQVHHGIAEPPAEARPGRRGPDRVGRTTVQTVPETFKTGLGIPVQVARNLHSPERFRFERRNVVPQTLELAPSDAHVAQIASQVSTQVTHVSDEAWESVQPILDELRSAPPARAQADRPASGARRHRLPAAERLPLEPSAEGVP